MLKSPLIDDDPVYDVVVLGAGYAGLMAALRLGRPRLNLRVALVNAEEGFVERVRLQESMVAEVKPRIRSLSRYLRGTSLEFVQGVATTLDLDGKRVRLELAAGGVRFIRFEQVIYALGSRVDAEKIPGAEQNTFRLDTGHGTRSARGLRARLHELAGRSSTVPRVLAVGGGALSVEAAGEVKSVWPHMDVSLVSAGRAGQFSTDAVERVLRRDLVRLGVTLLDNEPVASIEADHVVTLGGRHVPFDVCIWAAGMRSPAIAREAGLGVDSENRILVDSHLRSVTHPFVIAAGDAAHPVGSTGAPYRLSALTAAVSGVYAAEEAAAGPTGRSARPFSFSTFAQAVAVGRFGALFPLSVNDTQVLFVLGGRAGRIVRNVLVWLVLHFITLERYLPGVQTWPGHKRLRDEDAAESTSPGSGRSSSTVR